MIIHKVLFVLALMVSGDNFNKLYFEASEKKIPLANIEVTYHITDFDNKTNIVFINLHENERTSVEAAKAVMPEVNRYRLVELRSAGNRNLEFELRNHKYSIDPNRMFTRRGIRLSLERNSALVRGVAVRRVLRHSRELSKTFINKAGYVVALHNNTEANYAVTDYSDTGSYAADIARRNIMENNDPDDFFYTTDPDFFEFAKKAGMNVVLQNDREFNDDGSLSVYCGKKKIPYINIEAQHGHTEIQKRMTRVVLDYLAEKY